ncbi:peptidase domain-containing ABC transporter [Pedobacter alpinus]|uniref:Peptidase domain-containing ABC transporter n=1 Tax=Pedobacter alpinus TaxID=1590643 RepID=A0ABW5TNQ8_9SPHI
MAEKSSLRAAIKKLFQVINLEKAEIQSVYIYALLNGIILLSIPLGIQAIINLMFGVTISTSLIVLIVLVVFGVLLNGYFQIQQMRMIENLQQHIFTRLTFAYSYRIPKIKLSSIDNYYLPELVNRFFDTATLQKGLSKLLLDLPTATIQIFFGLILLGFYHPIFIIFGFLLFLAGLFIFYQSSSKGFQTSIEESDYKYSVASWLEELSRSIKTFKFNQQTDLHLNRTDELVSGYLDARNKHFKVLIFQYRVIIGFKVIITATMLVVGALLFVNQVINLGQFIATEIIIITIINALEKLIVSLELVYDVLTSLEKINKVLDKPQDQDDALITPENWQFKAAAEISIKNLSFGYDNKNKVLKNLNLEIAPGEKVCIKGFENSGKSTLLKFLTGMWPNFEGQFLFNRNPIQNISPEIFHREIAFHFTEDELFAGTLLENLTLGKPISNFMELQKVVALVGLNEFVNGRPDAFEAMLDPQGKKLSFNIAQKILIARCILKKPSLILLDEGWMRIDSETITKITDYLTAKNSDFTLIAITDDDEFAAKCDKVYIMENGKIK